jgi:hypothetical protein
VYIYIHPFAWKNKLPRTLAMFGCKIWQDIAWADSRLKLEWLEIGYVYRGNCRTSSIAFCQISFDILYTGRSVCVAQTDPFEMS